MELKLERYRFFEHCTIGRMYADGSFVCYTLEDKFRERVGIPVSEWKVMHQTAIPRGTYNVTMDFSNHFQKTMPHILDVPGFTGVRIHAGNTADDSSGCILVGGGYYGGDMITQSRKAYDLVVSLLEKSGGVATLKIT